MFKSKRALVNIVIFGSFLFIPFLPWYVPFACGVIYAWYVAYYELILLGFLMDVFFSSSHMSIVTKEVIIDSTIPFVSSAPTFIGTFFFTLIAGAIVFILQMIKKRVRFYS